MVKKKTPLQIENESAEKHKKLLEKKWTEYLMSLTVGNLNRDELCQMMTEQNEFSYKLIAIGRRDLL